MKIRDDAFFNVTIILFITLFLAVLFLPAKTKQTIADKKQLNLYKAFAYAEYDAGLEPGDVTKYSGEIIRTRYYNAYHLYKEGSTIRLIPVHKLTEYPNKYGAAIDYVWDYTKYGDFYKEAYSNYLETGLQTTLDNSGYHAFFVEPEKVE